jgi:hypothetical protein
VKGEYPIEKKNVVNYKSRKGEVTRQNKLEIPTDKDEVNKRKIRECDGYDPDTSAPSMFM